MIYPAPEFLLHVIIKFQKTIFLIIPRLKAENKCDTIGRVKQLF